MKLYELERQARRLALPKSQKAVFLCLISYSNRNGDGTSIFPGVATIALETSLCVRTVQYCLRELETAGWIIAINRKGGQGRPALYHLNLDQWGGLAAKPTDRPAPVERSQQQRLNYARGILKRLAADSPARPRWQEEVDALEQQLAGEASTSNDQAAHLPAISETPVPRYLPTVSSNDQALGRVLSEEEFRQLEIAYIGSVTAQARETRNSPEWKKWLPFIEPLRDEYNKALHQRGIVASDGHEPPMEEELEEQIQEYQRSQWQEEQRLRALIDERTQKRDALKPGTVGYRMWNALIEQATNTLKNGLFEQGGYVT